MGDFQSFEWEPKLHKKYQNYTYKPQLKSKNNNSNNDKNYKSTLNPRNVNPWTVDMHFLIRNLIHTKNEDELKSHIMSNLCNKEEIAYMQPKTKCYYDNFVLAKNNNRIEIFELSHVTHGRRCLYCFGHGGRPHKHHSLFIYEKQLVPKQKFYVLSQQDPLMVQRLLTILRKKYAKPSTKKAITTSQSVHDQGSKTHFQNISDSNIYKHTTSNNNNIMNNKGHFHIHTS